MLAEGQPAPDFTLEDQDGKPVTLSSFRGSPVVLYFYPRANTPGCTREACAFRDARSDYQAAGAVVLGVSPDKPKSLKKFAEKFTLPFTLLADPEHQVADAYGAWTGKTMFGIQGFGIQRSSFVIDREGVIARVFPKVRVDGHSEAVLEALRSL